MNDKRKICVFTGSRREYGHLYWLMKEIKLGCSCITDNRNWHASFT